jgi:hypothetical protein
MEPIESDTLFSFTKRLSSQSTYEVQSDYITTIPTFSLIESMMGPEHFITDNSGASRGTTTSPAITKIYVSTHQKLPSSQSNPQKQ